MFRLTRKNEMKEKEIHKAYDGITVEDAVGAYEATGTSIVLEGGHATGIIFGDYSGN